MQDCFVTLEKLCEHGFPVPLWTLRKWASQRLFPLYQPGGGKRIYVNPEEFRKWFEEYKTPTCETIKEKQK